jgi:hypothetical protein
MVREMRREREKVSVCDPLFCISSKCFSFSFFQTFFSFLYLNLFFYFSSSSFLLCLLLMVFERLQSCIFFWYNSILHFYWINYNLKNIMPVRVYLNWWRHCKHIRVYIWISDSSLIYFKNVKLWQLNYSIKKYFNI